MNQDGLITTARRLLLVKAFAGSRHCDGEMRVLVNAILDSGNLKLIAKAYEAITGAFRVDGRRLP